MESHQSRVYPPEVIARQAEMLGNRLRKTFRHRHGQFERLGIGAFRLYDRDIPEIRAVIDWYEGHVVLGEYVREQTRSSAWIEAMAASTAAALEIPLAQVHTRRRTTRPKAGERYQRLAHAGERMPVREGGLEFLVNLDDYLDTGLFLDHRMTRDRIRGLAAGKTFLNLFAYTGSFTAYAAAGGAKATTSIDLSARYLQWAEDNLKHNNLEGPEHRFVTAEIRQFLISAKEDRKKWDLIFVDPPSFSTRPGMDDFDVQRDHRTLVTSCLQVLAPGGSLFFSTNHQRFTPNLSGLTGPGADQVECSELTATTCPLDFKGRTPHRLFQLKYI